MYFSIKLKDYAHNIKQNVNKNLIDVIPTFHTKIFYILYMKYVDVRVFSLNKNK